MWLDEEPLGPVSVLAEPPLQKVVAPCAQWKPIPASPQRCFPKSREEERVRKRRKSEGPHTEVHGTRPAVGDYRLGGVGGVDGDQYARSVLAMVVLGVVGDGCDHCDRD